MRDKILYALGLISAAYLARNLYIIFLVLPDEISQGYIYRIIFFHVTAWFTCFSAFAAAAVASILFLKSKNYAYDTFAVAAVEVGLAFTSIGMVTGSIWARNQWGIWWTWDPRLTWAFITTLVYFGYLTLRQSIDEPAARARNSGVFCIFSFTSVAITYKAIDWWRTQHPGAVLDFRTGGGKMDAAYQTILYQNWAALMMLAAVLIIIRMRQESAIREIEGLRRHAHAL
jgi:heme exporter protein C